MPSGYSFTIKPEIIDLSSNSDALYVYDSEIFSNLYLLCFYNPVNDVYRDFLFRPGDTDTRDLEAFLSQIKVIVGFNQLRYDNVILEHFLKTGDVVAGKKLSDDIVVNKTERIWRNRYFFKQEYDVLLLLDRKGSLKSYQARLGLPEIVEWEGDFSKPIPDEEIDELIRYCHYDCWSTWRLFSHEETQKKIIAKKRLAERYQVDYNLTESDLGERVLESEIKKGLGLGERVNLRKRRTPEYRACGEEIISPKIKFRSEYLQVKLAEIKQVQFEYVEEGNNIRLRKKFAHSLTIETPQGQQLTIHLKEGGLHSIGIKAAVINPSGGKLINYDVGSYYPSAIDLLEIGPGDIRQTFLDVYRPILKYRLDAKAAGNKDAADVKIVLNAPTGRLKYKWSCLFNPVSNLSIVLNCQLFYLMLLEQFILADVQVLQVNTDGILIFPRHEQIDDVERIVTWWQATTGFRLDKAELDGILIKDSNNYAWIQGGEITKEKGKGFKTRLSLSSGCAVPLVVGKAVQAFFLSRIPVEKTIQDHVAKKDWLSFCPWKQQKNKEAGKRQIIRYAYMKKGEKRPGFSDLIQVIDNADKFMWEDLDVGKYSLLAREIVKSCGDEYKSPLEPVNGSQCQPAPHYQIPPKSYSIHEALGVLLDVDGYYCTYSGDFSTPVKWNWVRWAEERDISRLSYICLNPFEDGARNKTIANVRERVAVTIEYDNIPLDAQKQIFANVPYSVLCFSGNKSIHCHIRFSRALHKEESEQLDTYLALLFGDSDSSTWCVNQLVRIPGGLNGKTGKLQTILDIRERVSPEDFLAWIAGVAQEKGLTAENLDKPEIKMRVTPEPVLYFFQKWALDRELMANGNYRVQESSYNGVKGIGYWSHCPRKERHTNRDSHDSEFNIHLGVDGKLRKKCFHNSCSEIWRERIPGLLGFEVFTGDNIEGWLQTDEFKALEISVEEARESLYARKARSALMDVTSLQLPEIAECPQEEEYIPIDAKLVEELNQAIEEPAPQKLIISPPGSGKSFLSSRTFLKVLKEERRILYIGSNKSDLSQFIGETEEMAGATFRKLNCLELKSGKIRESDSQEDIEEIELQQDSKLDDYQGIATHHTYIQRKGLGATHYALLRWIEKHNPVVIIDEGNEFCNGCTIIVHFEGRYYFRKPNGAKMGSYYRLPKCPSFETGHHKCASCHRGSVLEFGVNKFNVPYIQLKGKIDEEEFARRHTVDISTDEPVDIPEKNIKVYSVIHNPEYLNVKEFKYRYDSQKGEGFSGIEDLCDLINCSYHPSIYTSFPTIDGEQVEEQNLSGLDTARKAKVKYPCQCCYTSLLYCKDKSGLFFIGRHAQELIILTTDLNSQNSAFMQECIPDLKILSVTQSKQKVKGILVLGFAKTPKIVHKDIVATDPLTQYGKVLIFQPTESRAIALYKIFPSRYPVARHIKDSVKLHGKFIDEPYHTVLAHSLGNLGKAINLPLFNTVLVDSRIYKPAIAMDLTGATPASLVDIIQTARFEEGKQNAGRIIREQTGEVGKSLKVVIFTNISQEDFEHKVKICRYEMMCHALDTFHFEEDFNALIQTAVKYFETGTAEKMEEVTRLSRAKDKDLSAIPPKQREEIRDEYHQVKLEKQALKGKMKLEELEQKVLAAAQEGQRWRDVNRKLHLSRLPRKDQNYLKKLFSQHNK